MDEAQRTRRFALLVAVLLPISCDPSAGLASSTTHALSAAEILHSRPALGASLTEDLHPKRGAVKAPSASAPQLKGCHEAEPSHLTNLHTVGPAQLLTDHLVLAGCTYISFFSSTGRHTRCLSDWSSDVCSS